jgi:hypothetical protein
VEIYVLERPRITLPGVSKASGSLAKVIYENKEARTVGKISS